MTFHMSTTPSFIIQGLAGKRTLKGTVHINGAKNSALKAMAAAILFDAPVTLENIPDTADVKMLTMILEKLGAKVCGGETSTIIDPTGIHTTQIDQDLAGGMRASVVLTGPLLARFKKSTFPAPGGCVIGARPIDLFLAGYKTMGMSVSESDCMYNITSPESLGSSEIAFEKISVGATETLMMAAVLGDGKVTLNNCAREPEIVNVAEWLNSCGAHIKGAGSSVIEIEGTKGKLLSPKKSFVTIPDRIEAGSFLLLAALCGEDIVIEDCRPDHLSVLVKALKSSGVDMEVSERAIWVRNDPQSPVIFKAFNVETKEYPGLATDVQPPVVTFLTQAEGQSKVVETIFEGRFKYIEDLIVLGADITSVGPQEIIVKGPISFKQPTDNTELTAHDIRAGFAVVMAALLGEGTFKVNNVHLIDRGYERLEERLRALGAKVERV